MCNFTRNSEPHRSVFSVSFANRTGNKWKGGEQLTALSFMKGEKEKTSETLCIFKRGAFWISDPRSFTELIASEPSPHVFGFSGIIL